jgi:hypothetical protein
MPAPHLSAEQELYEIRKNYLGDSTDPESLGDGTIVAILKRVRSILSEYVYGESYAAAYGTYHTFTYVAPLFGTMPVDDAGGSLTVDGSVYVTPATYFPVTSYEAYLPVHPYGGSMTVDDGGGVLTVDGDVYVTPATYFPVTSYGSYLPVHPFGGSMTVDDGGGSLTIDGDVGFVPGTYLPITNQGSYLIVYPYGDYMPIGTYASYLFMEPYSGTMPVDDAGGSLTIDGDVGFVLGTYLPVTVHGSYLAVSLYDDYIPITTYASYIYVEPYSGVISVDDGGSSLTVDGSVTVSGTVVVSSGDITVDGEVDTSEIARPASYAFTYSPGADTAAEIVLLAPGSGICNILAALYWSYNAAPTGGALSVDDGTDEVFKVYVTAAGPGFIPFTPPLKMSTNTPTYIVLAAGGGAVSGIVNVHAWTE